MACDNCGYTTKTKLYAKGNSREEKVRLCAICAKTLLSVAVQFPSQCPDTKLYKSIGYIANLLLDAIQKNQRAPEHERDPFETFTLPPNAPRD